MSVVKNSNKDILDYFKKFKDNENYEEYFKKLDELSILRLKGELDLGVMKMPFIGPSDDLDNFPDQIKNWKQEDIFELKNVIKLFVSGEIESVEEAIILIEILKLEKDYPKILDKITEDINTQNLNNIEDYQELLKTDDIIYSSIWKYLISITC